MSGRQRRGTVGSTDGEDKDFLSLSGDSLSSEEEDDIGERVVSALTCNSNFTSHSDETLQKTLDKARSFVDETRSKLADLDDAICRPRLLCINENVHLASKNTELLLPHDCSIVERCFLKMESFVGDEDVEETIQQLIWDRQIDGNEPNISADKLLAMFAHASACPLSELVPRAELPSSAQQYLDEHLTIAALPLVDPIKLPWLCIERVKFVLELISMSSLDFKDHELKLMLCAIIRIGSDELSNCSLLRSISKALTNLFSYLSEERKSAVFIDFSKSCKFLATTMDNFYLALQVMTRCAALSRCKLLCLERLLLSLSQRTAMQVIKDDVSSAHHFKTIVLLLCEYGDKALHLEHRDIHVFLNILCEVLEYDNMVDADVDDLSKMFFEMLEWKRSLMKRSTSSVAILVAQILTIINRIEMWRPSVVGLALMGQYFSG